MRRFGLVTALLALLALPAFLAACGGGGQEGETATKAKQETSADQSGAQKDAGSAYGESGETMDTEPAGTTMEAEKDTAGAGEEDAGGSPDDQH